MKKNKLLLSVLSAVVFSAYTPAGKRWNNSGMELFKENNQHEWVAVKTIESNNEQSILHLDYDSYYTLKLSETSAAEDISLVAEMGSGSQGRTFKFNIDPNAFNAKNGAENYFIDLPFALVSCTQLNINNHVAYSVQIKTKTPE